eukprot:11913201-Karenia_brevis.AAC.1
MVVVVVIPKIFKLKPRWPPRPPSWIQSGLQDLQLAAKLEPPKHPNLAPIWVHLPMKPIAKKASRREPRS